MKVKASYVFWAFVLVTVALLVSLVIVGAEDPRGITVVDIFKGAELILLGALVKTDSPTGSP